jgi:hypothetical protein
MFALAALLVGFSLLEEGEGLRDSRSSHGARAAFNFRNAVRILANELALRFRAVGLVAFPVTSGFFANGLTFGLGSLAVSNAMGLLANSNTLRAVEHFATFVRAFNFTLGFLTLHIADGVLGFSATGVAFGRLTDRVADSRAVRIVTFPGTLGVALRS